MKKLTKKSKLDYRYIKDLNTSCFLILVLLILKLSLSRAVLILEQSQQLKKVSKNKTILLLKISQNKFFKLTQVLKIIKIYSLILFLAKVLFLMRIINTTCYEFLLFGCRIIRIYSKSLWSLFLMDFTGNEWKLKPWDKKCKLSSKIMT